MRKTWLFDFLFWFLTLIGMFLFLFEESILCFISFEILIIIISCFFFGYYILVRTNKKIIHVLNYFDYFVLFTPMLSVDFWLLFSNLVEKKLVFGKHFLLVYLFFFILVISNKNWVKFESSKLLGVFIYLLVGHYRLELFCDRFVYVLLALFWFNYLFEKILEFLFEKWIPKNRYSLYKEFDLVFKFLAVFLLINKISFVKRTIIYFLLVVFPLLFSEYFGYSILGVIFVVFLLHLNVFVVKYYNYLMLRPFLFRKLLTKLTVEEREDLKFYLIRIYKNEEELRQEYTLCILVAIYKSLESVSDRSDIIFFDDVIQISSEQDFVLETPTTGFFVYGPGMFSFCISFIML